jgi:hypothetical protein
MKSYQQLISIIGSFLFGALIGILFHYMLYRIGLPITPFIYQAF